MVPGESYVEDDAALFDRVAAAVDAELRTLRVAQKIVADLRGAQRASERPELVLLRITDDLPGLRFLIPSLYTQRPTQAHRAQLVRGMGMVLTVVSARLRSLEAATAVTQRPPCTT